MKKIISYVLCATLLTGCAATQIDKKEEKSTQSLALTATQNKEEELSEEVCNEVQNILDDRLIDKKKELPENFGNKEYSILTLMTEDRMFAKDAEMKSLVKGYGKQVKLGKVLNEEADITDKFKTNKPKIILRIMSTCPSCKKMLNILKDIDIDKEPYELILQIYDKDLYSRKNTLAEIFKLVKEGKELPEELITREVIKNEETKKLLKELKAAKNKEEIIEKIAKIEEVTTDLTDSVNNIPKSLQKYIVYCEYKITDGILKINRYPSTIFLAKDKKLFDIGGCLTNEAIRQRIEDLPEFPADYTIEKELNKN